MFADPGDKPARDLLARSYRQLAWASENSVWRNIYLTGAQELTSGVAGTNIAAKSAIATSLPPDDLFDVLATRLDADKAGETQLRLGFILPDRGVKLTVTLAHGVITHRAGISGATDATVTVKYADLLAALLKGDPLAPKVAAGEASIVGDPSTLLRFTQLLDKPNPAFAIVTPE